MKYLNTAMALSVALTLSVFTGCSEDDDDDTAATPEIELLTAITDAQFATWTTTPVKDANYVNTNMADLFIVDLRAAVDFTAGHIEGAHNVTTLADLPEFVATNNTGDDEVALICYTGQTAAFANAALRMLGFDSFSMKWGMAGWNDALAGRWTTNAVNTYAGDMVTTASPALTENDLPTLSTGLESGEAILGAQIDAMLAEGFGSKTVTAATLMANPGDYEIYNYWSAEHYAIKHINGAIQLTPGQITVATHLDALDPDGTNVIYCYTGQTSAFTVFYLGVLGYDALSMSYGANALFHDTVPANAWALQGLNFPIVTN